MNYQNDDLRIKEIKELLPPVALLEKFPATACAAETVSFTRSAIHKILHGADMCAQIAGGERAITGVMVESHLVWKATRAWKAVSRWFMAAV